VRSRLRKAIKNEAEGSVARLAQMKGRAKAHVYDVLAGRKSLADDILADIGGGYRRQSLPLGRCCRRIGRGWSQNSPINRAIRSREHAC
jgi:hypothetical protein